MVTQGSVTPLEVGSSLSMHSCWYRLEDSCLCSGVSSPTPQERGHSYLRFFDTPRNPLNFLLNLFLFISAYKVHKAQIIMVMCGRNEGHVCMPI